jgi:tetratricopeptide (TPR) repeat protein
LIFSIVFIAIGFFACRNKDKSAERSQAEVQDQEEIEISHDNAYRFYEQGLEYYEAGELDAALEKLEVANRIWPNSPTFLRYLGHVNLNKGNYNAAISSYDKAIQLTREYWEGDESLYDKYEIDVYAKRGEAFFYMGNYDAALLDYSQAIRLDEKNSLYWNNRGEIYRSKGDYNHAIGDFLKAIEINNRYTEAFNNLGLVYYGMENYDRAIEYFNKVIEIAPYYPNGWNNRGGVWLEKGDYDRAIADFTRLLSFETEYDHAIVHNNRSRAYLAKREYQKAMEDCNRALQINRNYAPALSNRGNIYRETGEYQKALADYKECLEKAQESVNIHDISVYAWYLASMVYKEFPYLKDGIKTHNFWSEFAGRRLALDGISRGIRNAENIRQNMGVQGAGLMTQMIYLYYAGVDFEATLGSPENTFLYSESLRNRGFLEQLGTEAAIRLDGITESERNQFRQLRAAIEEQQAIINTYTNTKLQGRDNERYTAATQRRIEAEEKLAELDRTIGSLIPKYTELRNPKPVTLNEARAYCGNDRAVLEYVIWDATEYNPIKGFESWELKGGAPTVNSYCLVITKDGLTPVPLEPGFDYNKVINELRSGFSAAFTSISSYEKPRNDLYNQLIKPVLPYLQNITHITIVPDGDLALIPFDILRENLEANDFGKKYIISLSPSLSVSILSQNTSSIKYSPILFFANDEYWGKQYPDGKAWKNLPGVKNEIELLQDVVVSQNINFSSYFQQDATKEKIKQLSASHELRKYPIIHFACHGYFNKENSTESGLVLYQVDNDGYLTIPEVAALDLNAQMVILSACETGLVEAKLGEGMIGLVRAFMVAGAGKVGVSLWKIDDNTAPLFMKTLYQKVLGEEKPFAGAYKEVKETISEKLETRRPYFWAAFTMYE